MKTFVWHIIFLLLIPFSLLAEGTKEIMPANNGKCYVQFNESVGGQRYFALSTNTDTLNRLYIHIANVGEKIHVGFKKLASSVGDAKFRIKNAAGTVVYAFTNIPTAGAGYISTFAEANIGPSTLVGGAGGYNPLSYTTTTSGDFYIEFEKTSSTAARYLFEYFDITVSSAANVRIPGRVWSYAWDLNTENFTNRAYPVFYAYSDDRYITSVNINGMQPYSFVIGCNNTGAVYSGNLFNDRKSVASTNTMYPQYKIFLNPPDPTVYPIADIPAMLEDLQILGTPEANKDVLFYINMSKSGTLEIFLDIDGTAGYQSGGRDVVLVQHINAGGDTIIWDAKDGLGDPITTTISVIVSSKFATGVTHLPVYDAEKNTNGFLVSRYAPDGPEDLVLYWDDSNIPYGTLPAGQEITMLSGNTTANGHIWNTDSNNPNGFGDWHTINTWWNGYEINNLASFDFILLPINLTKFTVLEKKGKILLQWITESETNNDYFEIQKSIDGIYWHTIGTINGKGTTNKTTSYSFTDALVHEGISYYRLKQVDYDLKSTYSTIQSINISSISAVTNYNIFYNANKQSVTISGIENLSQDICLLTAEGKICNPKLLISKINDTSFEIKIGKLSKGIYVIKTKTIALPFSIQY